MAVCPHHLEVRLVILLSQQLSNSLPDERVLPVDNRDVPLPVIRNAHFS